MLIAQEQWLPQYKDVIKQVKIDWAKAEKDGTLIPTKAYEGAARLKTRTYEEMSESAEYMRKLASASSKESVVE